MVLSGFSYCKVEPADQDWLWFDKFSYKTVFKLHKIYYYRTCAYNYLISTLINPNVSDEVKIDVQNVLLVSQWVDDNKDLVKTNKHKNHITIYSTQYDILENLGKKLQQPTIIYEVPSKVVRPKGVIYHKNPKHKFRIYFKGKAFSAKEIDELREYFEYNKEHVFPSPSLQFILHYGSKKAVWIANTHFFDYDQESISTIFYMKFHECIGREFEIRQA